MRGTGRLARLRFGYQWYINTVGMAERDGLTTRPRVRRTRDEAKAETRRRVLEAAEEVFRRQGYHGASLDQVATEAGFTKGAVYSGFDSKGDLFLAVLSGRAQRRRAEIEALLADAGSAEEFVADVTRRFASSVAAERDLWAAVIEFMCVVGRDPALRARYAEHHAASRDAVAASVDEWAQRNGDRLEIEPLRLGTVVMAVNNGLTLEALLAPDDVDVELYVEAQLALLRGVVRG